MNKQKEPLYRKYKKTGLKCRNAARLDTGGEAKWYRNTKREKEDFDNEIKFKGMGGKKLRGYDYTPLYRFLQSKVGQDWNDIFSEAVSRLDKEEPIWYIVVDKYDYPVSLLDENSFWSALTIDDEGVLQFIDKNAQPQGTGCSCCTRSFNGIQMIQETSRKK